jgi:hypothetical protein
VGGKEVRWGWDLDEVKEVKCTCPKIGFVFLAHSLSSPIGFAGGVCLRVGVGRWVRGSSRVPLVCHCGGKVPA